MTDDAHELIGAYALDALDADERATFEQHLAGCAQCRTELDGLRESLVGLTAGYEAEPPNSLRDAVLAAVAEAPAPRAEPDPAVVPAPSPIADGDPVAGVVTPVAPVIELPQRSAGRSGRTRWQLLVAAAVALIAVIGIAVWQPWVARSVSVADVLNAPDAARATLTDQGMNVTLVRSNRLGRAVLIAQNLPPAPSGKVRQAWIKHPGDHFMSAGLMPAGSDVTMLLEGDARDATGAGISVEPAGGSQQPTIDDVIALVGF